MRRSRACHGSNGWSPNQNALTYQLVVRILWDKETRLPRERTAEGMEIHSVTPRQQAGRSEYQPRRHRVCLESASIHKRRGSPRRIRTGTLQVPTPVHDGVSNTWHDDTLMSLLTSSHCSLIDELRAGPPWHLSPSNANNSAAKRAT